MSKHTPGPWHVESADSDGANVVAIAQVAWCGTNGSYGRDASQTISAKEAKANARLIAAAPDLLEALEELLYARTDKAEQMAHVAITKAKGKV